MMPVYMNGNANPHATMLAIHTKPDNELSPKLCSPTKPMIEYKALPIY